MIHPSRMINEIGKDLEGSGMDRNRYAILAISCRDLRRTMLLFSKDSRYASEIGTWDLHNSNDC
jgi:hypothetical protein